jgi:DNA-3-methyladenine glycosylase I
MKEIRRCSWATNELNIPYHDTEWGVPLHDEHGLFEFLILEGAQAGLSWDTVLRKREAYREAFAGFDPAKVARFNEAKCEKLLTNDGIIRNRLKIASAVRNAKAYLRVQADFGSFDKFIWSFVDGKPIDNRPKHPGDVPARTEVSDKISNELKKRGFNFVGSTIMYAFMQATGMVNDHLVTCFRCEEVGTSKDSVVSYLQHSAV